MPISVTLTSGLISVPKTVMYIYTFIDEQRGELADILAPNESVARLWLGGDWILPDRCPLFAGPSEVADWDKVIKVAQEDAAEAFVAMNAAQPSSGITTSEALGAFNDAVAEHKRTQERVTKLIKMSVNAA